MEQTDLQKIRVGILYGGKSAEHEVSIRSAENVTAAMDKSKYEPVLVKIDKDGVWQLAGSTKNMTLVPGDHKKALRSPGSDIATSVDVIFPILHGPMGEDGTVQGMLELAGIPYVGSGVLGSAIGMDKDITKRLLRQANIEVTDFITIWDSERQHIKTADIIERLGLPLFVKPANMGSSIGVAKVSDQAGLQQAIDQAFEYDHKVLAEAVVEGDEIECAVLGNDDPQTSAIGRILPRAEFYSYDAKYIDEDGAELEIPAKLPQEVLDEAQATALKAYRVLECQGMARVDMFATSDGRVLVNEINTIPGFTDISMYPKLWEASGLEYGDLISRLIELSLERFQRRQQLKVSYRP